MTDHKASLLSMIYTGLATTLSFFLLVTAFLMGPELWHRLRSPDMATECRQIQPGKSKLGVLEFIHRKAHPADEFFDQQGRLVLARDTGVCLVEFDASRTTVVKARFEPASIGLLP